MVKCPALVLMCCGVGLAGDSPFPWAAWTEGVRLWGISLDGEPFPSRLGKQPRKILSGIGCGQLCPSVRGKSRNKWDSFPFFLPWSSSVRLSSKLRGSCVAGSRLEQCCAWTDGREASASLELGRERSWGRELRAGLSYHWCVLVRKEYSMQALLLRRGRDRCSGCV